MRKLPIPTILFYLLFWFSCTAMAVDEKELLEPDAAFQLITAVKTPNTLEFFWDIADGYYLYRDKIKWVSLTPGIDVEATSLPKGVPRLDQFFGDVEVYRDHLAIELPIRRHDPALNKLNLEVTYQGCADVGVCYLPVQKTLHSTSLRPTLMLKANGSC